MNNDKIKEVQKHIDKYNLCEVDLIDAMYAISKIVQKERPQEPVNPQDLIKKLLQVETKERILELLKEPEVLRPYEHKRDSSGNHIDYNGEICSWSHSDGLFSGSGLKPIAKQLKRGSIIHRLKQSAGCGDYEFVEGKENNYIYFNNGWQLGCTKNYSVIGVICFPTEHAERIFAGFLECVKRNEV